MDPKLGQLFDELESQRERLLSTLKEVNEEELLKSDSSGRWSIAEILSHLVAAEKMSLQYIRKKMLGIEKAGDSGLWEELKMILLIISQRLPGLKFKAPKVVVEGTRIVKDLPSVQREWDEVREDLKKLLETIPPHLKKRKIYKHVIAGYINISQAMIFFREHINHHMPQVFSQVTRK